MKKYSKIKLTDEDLNIILDGLQDTLIRNKKGELKEEEFEYVSKVIVLKKRVEMELSNRKKLSLL